ncbi:hypothetical protein SSX86_012191 [Deinandra increscens subsp. villosa]|uniref:F-box domain-containing protein n=1 Tax=Deinandra increscens subsp. villosa TaxID=3103831 RepID=A0AAP0D3R1_9ASTR
MAQLPSENMYDIFSRMPVKSLARFRSVSKLWRNSINDSYLETMHAERATTYYDPMLIMFRQILSHLPNSSCTLSFLEYKEEEDQKGGYCSTLNVRKKPPVMEFTCKSSGSRFPDDIILGSCNGLIYSSRGHPGHNTLVVIHPLRRECYELPPIRPPFHTLHSWVIDLEESFRIYVKETYGLGFDISTNTFKMVAVVVREEGGPVLNIHDQLNEEVNQELCAMVHVLGTDSWRKIHRVPAYPVSGEGVFANGCLHWLISDDDDDGYPAYLGRPVVSFEMAKEEFGLIDPPQERPSGWVREQLVDLDGEVGYAYNIVNRRMEVWVLKEGGWVVHCVFKQRSPLPSSFIKVLGFWNQNGDVLMTDCEKHMFVYNLKSDSLHEINFVGREEENETNDIRMYRSSLFSTRYSIKK